MYFNHIYSLLQPKLDVCVPVFALICSKTFPPQKKYGSGTSALYKQSCMPALNHWANSLLFPRSRNSQYINALFEEENRPPKPNERTRKGPHQPQAQLVLNFQSQTDANILCGVSTILFLRL